MSHDYQERNNQYSADQNHVYEFLY